MKKSLFYVALAATVLTSCKKDDNFANNPQQQEKGVAIALNLSNPVTIETATRSTGAVGDLEGQATNVWKGQELNVFMLHTGSLTPAKTTYYTESEDKYGTVTPPANYNPVDGDSYDLFFNTPVKAPTGEASGVADYGYEKKYYPEANTFDFFAYHDDDAVELYADGGKITLGYDTAIVDDPDTITINVQIDGSQDLMVAKAAPTTDQITKLQAEHTNLTENLFYSAFAARRNVQPDFTFNHLLSRFVFNVTPGNEKSAGETGIRIDKIYITDVKNKAKMVVASTDEDMYTEVKAENFLTWESTTTSTDDDNKETTYSTADMYLQERGEDGQMTELKSVYLEWTDADDETPAAGVKQLIGESLLLPANEAEYNLVIEYSQRPHCLDDYTSSPEYVNAYNAAKQEAFDAAYAEAYAEAEKAAKETAEVSAKEQDYEEAKRAAYDEAKLKAYLKAKEDGTIDPITDVASWTWKDEEGKAIVLTVANEGNEVAWTWSDGEGRAIVLNVTDGDNQVAWTWPLKDSWSNNWEWTEGADWKWETTEGIQITIDNWVWDGEAAWVANFEVYKNRVYKGKAVATLALGTGKVFEAGKQYNVNFTVYGLEEIKLTMTLTGWQNGGDLNFDNDGPFEPINVTYENEPAEMNGGTGGDPVEPNN